ncbi:MAG: cation/multidrug efflux pump [Gammaproteobacteria bacterium]
MNESAGLLLVIALGLAGLVLLLLGVGRLWRRRLLTGGGLSLGGAALLALALLVGTAGAELYTYHRLTMERPVAVLRFSRIGPHHYRVLLAQSNAPGRRFELYGDQWELDARVLKWRGLAVLLGMDPVYRLERLSGRYQALAGERNGPRSVYELASARGPDLWLLADRYRGWIPWVDTVYGSATYMPMADQAVYDVRITTGGLIARPANMPAREALAAWR